MLTSLLKVYEKKNPIKSGGRTALHVAAMKGFPALVKKICYHLDDYNPPDDHGYTPLHLASAKGKYMYVTRKCHPC